jgi:hypothetical protein
VGERERLARFCIEALGRQGLACRNGCRVSGLVRCGARFSSSRALNIAACAATYASYAARAA